MSTMTCEHVFSVQTLIRTKGRNKLGSNNLKEMLRIALELPDEGVDIINDVVTLWKTDNI
jgi:hypothetical protein